MSHWVRFALAACLLSAVDDTFAQALLLLPSVELDQRFDDNYRLTRGGSESISATRVVGNLGLNRESEVISLRSLLRADALLAVRQNSSDELDSNQFVFLSSEFNQPRSSYGLALNYKRDTPNRDISSDITDVTVTASDSGAAVTQDQNVERKRLVVKPGFSYNLSRRSKLNVDYTLTDTDHGLPSCEDAVATFDPSGEQENPVFTPDELDDFTDNQLSLSYRYSLSTISSFSTALSYSQFEADEEIPDAWVRFEDKVPDQRCLNVRRNPRLPTTVDTMRFTLGYERKFSETLIFNGQIGFYTADSNKMKTVNPLPDRPVLNQADPDYDASILPLLYEETSTEGYLLNLSLRKETGVTSYSGKVGVEVYPSDVGDIVESLDLVGDVTRQLNPRLKFNFRIRAFEPDTISDGQDDDEFARRFLSIEPRLIWNISRAFSMAGSFRYRRQKSQAHPESSQSNAFLLTFKYTPLSELNQTAQQ